MTDRKPSSLSVPDWIERQIRQAQDAGAFTDLPGAGKPIPGIDNPRHELAWVAGYLRREDVDTTALLAPSLALAKEVEDLPHRLVRERDESRARAVIERLNERIHRAYAAPQTGPPLRVKLVDVETALAQRRRAREALALADRLSSAAATAPPEPSPPRSRWLPSRRLPRPGRRRAGEG